MMAKSFPNTGVTTGTAADRAALTSPFAGMQFFETDTNKVLVYSGSSWVETNDLDNLGGVSDAQAALPLAEASRSTPINLVSYGEAMKLDIEVFDNDNIYTTSNSGVFTASTAGWYEAYALVNLGHTSAWTSTPLMRILTNYGGISAKASRYLGWVTSTYDSGYLSTVIRLDAGNYMYVDVQYGSGGTVSWLSHCRAGIRWVNKV